MKYLEAAHPLPTELEHALVQTYLQTRDRNIETQLVVGLLRLVPHLARSFRCHNADYQDLLQEGNLGVLQAVRRYNPELGKLSSYAAWWIRAYQLRFLLANHRLVKLGTSQPQRKIFFQLGRVRAELEARGVSADAAAIAQQIGVPIKALVETQDRMTTREASLDVPLQEDSERTLLDSLSDQRANPEECFAAREQRLLLTTAAATVRAELGDRDRALFDARWTEEPVPTLQEMARRFGISRERARQLNDRIVQKFRRCLRDQEVVLTATIVSQPPRARRPSP